MITDLHARLFCSKDIAEARLGICRECDNFGKQVPKFCAVCSCFMPAKVMLRGFACPLEKWPTAPLAASPEAADG